MCVLANIVCDHFDSFDSLTNLSSPVCVPATLNQTHHIAAIQRSKESAASIYRDFCVFIFISKSNYSLHLNNIWILHSRVDLILNSSLSISCVVFNCFYCICIMQQMPAIVCQFFCCFPLMVSEWLIFFHGIASQSTEINCLLLIPKSAQCTCILHISIGR